MRTYLQKTWLRTNSKAIQHPEMKNLNISISGDHFMFTQRELPNSIMKYTYLGLGEKDEAKPKSVFRFRISIQFVSWIRIRVQSADTAPGS
jgi:hypothetical protein